MGIRTKLLLTLAALLIFVSGALTLAGAVSMYTLSQRRQSATDAEILLASQQRLLVETRLLALETSRLLDLAEHDLHQFSALSGVAFERAEPDASLDEPEPLVRLPGGQLVGQPSSISTVFVPAAAASNPDLQEETIRSAALDSYWAALFEDNAAVRRLYFGTTKDLLRTYPRLDRVESLPPNFKPTAQDWYVAGTPENNPDRRPRWIPARIQVEGAEQVVTLSLPVYTSSGDFVGVLGMDLSLAQILEPLQSGGVRLGGYSFLVDNQGRAFGLPEQGFQDLLGRTPEAGEISAEMQAAREVFTPILARMLTSGEGSEILQTDERKLVMSFAPLETTNWSIGTVLESETLLQVAGVAEPAPQIIQETMEQILTRLLPLNLAVLFASLIIAVLLANSLTKPIRYLAVVAEKISASEWRAPILQTRNDELGLMESSLESLRSQLYDTKWERDRLAASQTSGLESVKPSSQVSAAVTAIAEVGLVSARESDLNALLDQIVQLINHRLGYELVALYQSNPTGEEAVLQALHSSHEQSNLAHRIRFTSEDPGPIGFVLRTGEIFTPDIQGESGSQANMAHSGEAHIDLALPLKAGGRLLGVLQVRSAREGGFSEEEIETLGMLADQTGFALYHFLLLQNLQESPQEPGALSGETSAQGLFIKTDEKPAAAFEFDRNEVSPAGVRELNLEAVNRLEAGEMVLLKESPDDSGRTTTQLLTPIRLLGKTVGVLGFEMVASEDGLDAEQLAMIESLAGQAALALENARLLEEAQQRASNERLLSEVTCRIRETLNIDTVLQTAATEIQQRLNLQEVRIRLGENE